MRRAHVKRESEKDVGQIVIFSVHETWSQFRKRFDKKP